MEIDAGILSEIRTERHRQDLTWGGREHDDRHGPADWVCILAQQIGKAINWSDGVDTGLDYLGFRRGMIRVAAVAIAAVESADRVMVARSVATLEGDKDHRE